MNSIATYVIISYCVLGVLLLLIAIKRAPSGYEDESGFHLDPEQEASRARSPVRSSEVYANRARLEGARPPWPLAGAHDSGEQADAA